MRNLFKIYQALPDKQEGLDWYVLGYEFCKKLSEKYSQPLPVVCAIVSALSPATNWEQNKKDAVRLLESNEKGLSSKSFTTYGQNVRKAHAILEDKLDPLNAFSMKTGPKTYNFFHNLLNPYDSDYVTVDRHAYTIAVGANNGRISPLLYKKISDGYRRAAGKAGILPNQLQAVLWVTHRKENVNQFKEYMPF